jgi:Sec-independent protein translocase protein TatA
MADNYHCPGYTAPVRGKKIPELMRGLGQGIAEFKKGMREGDVDQPKKDSAEKREQ